MHAPLAPPPRLEPYEVLFVPLSARRLLHRLPSSAKAAKLSGWEAAAVMEGLAAAAAGGKANATERILGAGMRGGGGDCVAEQARGKAGGGTPEALQAAAHVLTQAPPPCLQATSSRKVLRASSCRASSQASWCAPRGQGR